MGEKRRGEGEKGEREEGRYIINQVETCVGNIQVGHLVSHQHKKQEDKLNLAGGGGQ